MSLRGRQARVTSLAPVCRFLIVTVGGLHFALPAERIQGLLTIVEAGSAGSLTVQNVTYASIDLAGRLQLSADVEGQETRAVLLSHGNSRGNIRVAQVHGLRELEQSRVLPLPGHFQGEEQTWYQGMVLFEDGIALILNPAWLLEGCGHGRASGMVNENDAATQLLPARPALAGGQV